MATQTCDIVRTCSQRPFVEVLPLVEVDEKLLYEIKQIKRPQYAYIPGVAELNLVADRSVQVEVAGRQKMKITMSSKPRAII